MKIYNTKHNKLEEFVPIHDNKVSMYVCGPTVYNHPHIGNARPIVVFDLLRRVLKASGYDVTMVSNFTDIDDKIINKALEEGVSEAIIAARYIDAYNDVREKLNAKGITSTPYATQSVPAIIKFIDELCKKDFAYEVNGDVYFRVNKIKDYGEISSQNIEQLQVGSRIEANDFKENPLDFALWKKTDDLGIKWDSPWGQGRPGWHTECVVMIQDEFNTSTIDIHGGGQDLKFPHHENESAQCKAMHNHDLANYWVHNAMLNLDGIKMSKSLGNVQWAKDYIEQFGGNLTRWILLSSHYRLTLNITEETIEQSKIEMTKVKQIKDKLAVERQLANVNYKESIDSEMFNKFLGSLQDDLNVSNALVSVYDLIKLSNQALRTKEKDWNTITKLESTLDAMLDVLGYDFETPLLSEEDRNNFDMWATAKANKDYETADVYRHKLSERGLI